MVSVSIPGDIDPDSYETEASFKAAVYDAAGTGSWLDDIKLAIMWREAHGKELEDHMKALVD